MPASKTVQNKKHKIFVVDDHPLVRQGLALIINQESDMMFAGEAGEAQEALENISKSIPDLIVLDISLKGTSGIELCKSILNDFPKMPILFISMYDEQLYVERVLKVGGKGYLMKEEATNEIVSAIRKILSGEIYVSDKMKDSLLHRFASSSSKKISSPIESLTDRELEVLQWVGQGFSTRQVASKLFVSVKTIESHFANIKNKLDLKNSNELIQYAVKWCLTESNIQ